MLGAGCPDGSQVAGGRALTSLNSWIWACSNMEKTLEEPRWACLVAAALPRVPAFLLACNTVGAEGSSPQLPEDSLPRTSPEHSWESPGQGPLPVPGDRLSGPNTSTEVTGSAPPAQRTAPGGPLALSPPHLALTIVSLCSSLVAARGPQPPLCLSLITWRAPNKDRRRG